MATFQIIDTASQRKLNIIEYDGIAPFALPTGQALQPDDGRPIWVESSEMPDISDRQFARGLWGDGLIDFDEFIAFVGIGEIPPVLQALVDTLPDDDTGRPTARKDAVGFLAGSKTYQFNHPLVEVIRVAQKWTPERLRRSWMDWSSL